MPDRIWGALHHWPWAAFPLLAVFVLVASSASMPADLAAARGEGVVGTFTAVDDLGCGRSPQRGCSWGGTFVSDDGTVRDDDVFLFDGRPDRVGERVRARHVGTSTVYAPDGDTSWRWNLGLQVAAVATLVGTAVLAVRQRRRNRAVDRPAAQG